jgi:hypothetical protein
VALFPRAMEQALSRRIVREETRPDWCNMATRASADDDVCIVRGLEYSKDGMFEHVSGCYCYLYMNDVLFKPNTTIRKSYCWDDTNNITYPCFLVSTMHFTS